MSSSVESCYVTCCRCGHGKSSPAVRPIKRYSFWGMMCLMMGYTSLPVRVEFVCANCDAVFDVITNRKMLERFRFDEPGPADK